MEARVKRLFWSLIVWKFRAIFVAGVDDQYTAEFFYRITLSQNFVITPDVQRVRLTL